MARGPYNACRARLRSRKFRYLPLGIHGEGNAMGILLNLRGAGGAGKTALARRLMASYGPALPVHHPGLARPAGALVETLPPEACR